jgi:MerR family transcriptional regulator, light-induced transcriptional regulator
VLVELLAPAARHLGIDWSADRIDFVQVSMGLWRLQEVMRELTARVPHPTTPQIGRSALFSAMPRDDHDFGAAMVHECFSLAGWEADLLVAPSRSDLLDHIAVTSLDLVGLTVTCDSHIEPLPALIRAIRSVSMNPDLRVMIGGRVSSQDPSLVLRVGADGTARTATTAVVLAEKLVDSVRTTAPA